MFGNGQKSDLKTVTDPAESPDITGASPINGANELGAEGDAATIFATVDRIRFKSLYEAVNEVLVAHGFVSNIENLLAALDYFKFGIRAELPSDVTSLASIKVRSFSDCIQFKLPEKRRSGPMLKMFYEEVGAYEAEILRLSGSADKKPAEKDQEIRGLRQQVERLREQNDELSKSKEELIGLIQELEHYRSKASKTIEEQNLLPPNIKAGKVREISLEENRVVVKTGRASMVLALGTLNSFPSIGSGCLVVQKPNKEPDFGIVFGEECEAFRQVVGTVLSIDGSLVKVRDERRKCWTAEYRETSSQSLRPGDRVLLRVIKDVPISISVLKSSENDQPLFEVQAENIANQCGKRQLKEDIELSIETSSERETA
jgi:hypothetical protein